jgi:hypothetical protein
MSNDKLVVKNISNPDITIKWYYNSYISNINPEFVEVKKGDSIVIIYETVDVVTDVIVEDKNIIIKQFEPSRGIINTKNVLTEVFDYKIIIDTTATYDEYRFRPDVVKE